MSKKIKIDVVNPASGDGNDLKNCYFQEESGQLNFYSSTGTLLYQGVQLNTAFNATVDNIVFTITLTAYVAETSASGSWSDPGDARVEPGVGGEPESGSFQAQAGGTVEEEASSAVAR